MSISYFQTANTLITGSGSIATIGEQARKFDAKHVVIVTDSIIKQTGLLDNITTPLSNENISYSIMDKVIPEPPFENLEEMISELESDNPDLLIGVGGGSALDITKLLSVMLTNKEDVRNFIGTDMNQEQRHTFHSCSNNSWNRIGSYSECDIHGYSRQCKKRDSKPLFIAECCNY